MRAVSNSVGRALSAAEVVERKERCKANSLCYISLVPLTDETTFNLIGPDGLMCSVHKKYGETALTALNKADIIKTISTMNE